jgi:hypothetical protein
LTANLPTELETHPRAAAEAEGKEKYDHNNITTRGRRVASVWVVVIDTHTHRKEKWDDTCSTGKNV